MQLPIISSEDKTAMKWCGAAWREEGDRGDVLNCLGYIRVNIYYLIKVFLENIYFWDFMRKYDLALKN